MLGTEPQLRERYVKTGQLRLVFHPIVDLGIGSLQAHQAAQCAGEQGMFWPMHDLLFAQQSALYRGNVGEAIKGLAARLALDTEQFNTCLDEQRYAGLVRSQDEQRRQAGIRNRPTFDINGQLLVGGQPFAAFQHIIEPLLNQ